MRGNEIVVSTERRGVDTEGYVGAGLTFYPGMCVERDPTVALKSGRHTYKYYTPGADGGRPKGPFWIVTNTLGAMFGKTCLDSIAAGERVSLYSPVAGEEINLLLADIAGTADDHAAGEVLICKSGTGKFIATTGTPDTKPAMLLETVTDPTTDTLAWCVWSGH
jgi:hypothetical protein